VDVRLPAFFLQLAQTIWRHEQVTEWNLEGTGISESGTDLRAFLSELNARGNGKPVTLSINLLMSLGNGGEK